VTLFHSDLYELDIQCYDKAIAIEPNYFRAWYNKGLALYSLGEHHKAMESIDKVLEIEPTHPYAGRFKKY
jgi:tetratricopeptide (TPR) repeat protein